MNEDPYTVIFEQYRAQLIAVAYQMLGERSAAEDIVQETWVRWNKHEKSEIKSHIAWLRTVTTRIAIDSLKSARSNRESYVGPWLPEPILDERTNDPEHSFAIAKECELAMLCAMERLTPYERSAFILRKVFDSDYAEIALTLDKSESACRKLVSRASERIRLTPTQQTIETQSNTISDIATMMECFAQACSSMDHQRVLSLLAPDVTAISDGGGKVRAALRPLKGQQEVCHVLLSIISKSDTSIVLERCTANNQPAIRIRQSENHNMIFTLRLNQHGKIDWIYILRNPDKFDF